MTASAAARSSPGGLGSAASSVNRSTTSVGMRAILGVRSKADGGNEEEDEERGHRTEDLEAEPSRRGVRGDEHKRSDERSADTGHERDDDSPGDELRGRATRSPA